MLGELNNNQVEDILTYVVPITYVYDGANIYGHSAAGGMKMQLMRKNPNVCFEVDVMQNLANWQSVIAWGRFEEITSDNERQEAMKKLVDKVMPLLPSETAQPTHGLNVHMQDAGHANAVLYKIKIAKKTGRFEKR
jgi:uncharacterized protein